MPLTSSGLQPGNQILPSKPCKFCSLDHTCASCAHCMDIKRRVSDATAALDCVLEEQRQMKERMNAVHDPINRLPVEISSHIFGLCLPPIPHFEGRESLQNHSQTYREDATFQLMLGAVCRRWRHILWTNPSFWRCVSVVFSASSPLSIFSLVHEWLSRSADLSLVICLEYEDETGYQSDDEAEMELSLAGQALLDAICGVADRWSIVVLFLPSSYIHNLHIKTSQPRFLYLYLQTTDFNSETSLDFGGASGPNHLEVHDISLENLHIQWSAVTHFYQGSFNMEECLKVLRQAPHLVSAEICDDHDPDLSISTVTNSTIQNLKLIEPSAQIWQSLTLPALVVLDVDAGELGCIQNASDFVHQSQCHLKIAKFTSFGMKDGLLAFLESIPSLEQLNLVESTDNLEEALFNLLAETETNIGGRFLPNLSCLSITSVGDFSWSSMASIISAKSSSQSRVSGRQLHTVSMKVTVSDEAGIDDRDTRFGIDAESLRKILELIDAGVNIDLRNGDDQDIVEAWIKQYRTRGGDYEWLKSYHRA